MPDRVQASKSEGIGLEIPERNPDHADPEWFQRDLDDLESNDDDGLDPLPTARHRQLPDPPE